MNFQITKQELAKGLGVVGRLAVGRMPLPILNNVLIETQPNSLIFSTTDLELGVSVKLAATTSANEKFTVPARLFGEFIQNCNDQKIEGSVTDGATLALKTENSGVKIRGADASEYPGLPFQEGTPTLHLPAKEFKMAIDTVSYATAIDETRPVLAGALFYTEDDHAFLVATDSHRLAEKRIKLPTKLAKNCSVIVPKKTLQELARLLADEVGDISVFVGDNQIQFEFGPVRVVSRLIEGNYPPYKTIIPDKYQTRATANHGDFVSSLKLVGLFSKDAGNIIQLVVIPGKGMTVQSLADQKGEANSRLTAIVEGEELTISFNVKYLLDALNAIAADNLFIEFNGPDKAAVVRPANSKEYLALVMPLKVD